MQMSSRPAAASASRVVNNSFVAEVNVRHFAIQHTVPPAGSPPMFNNTFVGSVRAETFVIGGPAASSLSAPPPRPVPAYLLPPPTSVSVEEMPDDHKALVPAVHAKFTAVEVRPEQRTALEAVGPLQQPRRCCNVPHKCDHAQVVSPADARMKRATALYSALKPRVEACAASGRKEPTVDDAMIEVWWVDQEMWFPAVVYFMFESPAEGMYLYITWPTLDANPEEMNLMVPSVLSRVRLLPARKPRPVTCTTRTAACFTCGGAGCAPCSGTGWHDVLCGVCTVCNQRFDLDWDPLSLECRNCAWQSLLREETTRRINESCKPKRPSALETRTDAPLEVKAAVTKTWHEYERRTGATAKVDVKATMGTCVFVDRSGWGWTVRLETFVDTPTYGWWVYTRGVHRWVRNFGGQDKAALADMELRYFAELPVPASVPPEVQRQYTDAMRDRESASAVPKLEELRFIEEAPNKGRPWCVKDGKLVPATSDMGHIGRVIHCTA
jgi:hypothetical protein